MERLIWIAGGCYLLFSMVFMAIEDKNIAIRAVNVKYQARETALKSGLNTVGNFYAPPVEVRYTWPIHIEDYTQKTSPFGLRTVPRGIYKIGGAVNRDHEGLDLTGTWHARVVAVAGGEVIDKWYVPNRYRKGHPLFGGYIRILHPNGEISGYGHLSEIYVREGDQVQSSQVIGRIGNTGLSAGEHLHFSMLNVEGDFINPLAYMEAR